MLNCEIHQRAQVSTVADMELILLIIHLIWPPGSIPGVGWVRRNQTNNGRLCRVADMELILLLAHLIRPPGSIPGVGWVGLNQTKQKVAVPLAPRVPSGTESASNGLIFFAFVVEDSERKKIEKKINAENVFTKFFDYFVDNFLKYNESSEAYATIKFNECLAIFFF